jgi:hypothetical protein
MKSVLIIGSLLLLAPATSYTQSAAAARFATPAAQHAFLNQYCAYCHNDQTKSGSMSLTSLDLSHITRSADLAEKVIRKVRVGLMPPPGMPRPKPAVIKAFAESLENAVDQAAALHPNPGRPALHRLNRTEYSNAIHDLLDVDVDVSSLLPTDDMSHGFDNMADALTISPALMEGYIRAAGRISREAVGDSAALALTSTYTIPRIESQTRHMEGTPIGTRGGMSIVHDFPADGQYVFKIGFYYAATGSLFGQNQGKGQQVEIAVNGAKVALLDVNPAMTLAKDGMKTPPIEVKAGPAENLRVFHPVGGWSHRRRVPHGRTKPGGGSNRFAARHDHAAAPARIEYHRPGQGGRRLGYAQPPQNLHLPARARRRRTAVRQTDYRDTGASGVSPPGHRQRSGRAANFLPGRPQSRRF